MWGQDLRRSIDYLESRKDIDAEKLAYCGASWGSAMAPMMLAIEPRIKAAVLIVAGFEFQKALPQADEINYISHVAVPVIMLNGKYDFFFPYQTSQVPFFEMLGTPKEKKKLFVYDGGHSVPRTEMIKESLAWLDKYLGPVEESANR
jgi:dienelactone hydrolase